MRREGRVVERVRMPTDLIAALVCEADRRRQPLSRVAGDLVAEVLPSALAEAAADLLGTEERSLEKMKSLGRQPQALPSERVAALTSSTVPAGGAQAGHSSDGTD
jgi:hypothetical protein